MRSSRAALAKFVNVTVDNGTVGKNLLIVTLIIYDYLEWEELPGESLSLFHTDQPVVCLSRCL